MVDKNRDHNNSAMMQDGQGKVAEDPADTITDQEETKQYLSLAGMGPQDDSFPVDRSRSIFELIDERKYSSSIMDVSYTPILFDKK